LPTRKNTKLLLPSAIANSYPPYGPGEVPGSATCTWITLDVVISGVALPNSK